MRLHAPSRRELLLGSGTLFAWAHLPKLARAESATRAFSRSFFAARWTDLRRWLRSAIRIGSRSAPKMR
jgi:hypothetical protein